MISPFKAQRKRNYDVTFKDGSSYSFQDVSEVKALGNPGDMTTTAYEFVRYEGSTVIRADEIKMFEYWEVYE